MDFMDKKIDLIRTDFSLLFCVLILVMLGAASVYSASSFRAEQYMGDSAYYFRNHLIRAIIGFICLVVVASFNYRLWLNSWHIFFWVSFALVAYLLTHGPGVVVRNGAASWIRIGPLMFQPSDFARYALVLALARVLHDRREQMEEFSDYLLPMGFVLLMVVPMALEPDLGTAALTILTAGVMFIFAELPVFYILVSSLTVVTGVLCYLIIFPHGSARLEGYKSGLLLLPDMPYQLKQAIIALSQGGVIGRGIGESRQKFLFLPEAHNDFIFAMIGEEYGLIGTVGVLVLFAIIIHRGIVIAREAPDGYGRLLAGGITASIASYALINAGVAIGMLPITGIPMPFLSYGGSAIITHLAAVGLLLNISAHSSPSFARTPGWRVYRSRLQSRIFKSSGRPVFRTRALSKR